MMTCDLLHKIESDNLNTSLCWAIIKELKRIRIERRKVKNDKEIMRVFKEGQNKLLKKENRQMLLADVNKSDKRLKTTYHNRVYSEDFSEIFKKEE